MPNIDDLLAAAEKAAAQRRDPAAIEHIVVQLLQRAKENPELGRELERIDVEMWRIGDLNP